MTWLAQYKLDLIVLLGFAFIACEWLFHRFNKLFFFSFGIGLLVTAAFVKFSLIGIDYISIGVCSFVATVIFFFVFRPPYRNLRSVVDPTRAASDLVGYRFLLVNDLSNEQKAIHHYSGIAWRLRSKDTIKAGTWVEVVRAEVGEFTIRPRLDL